MASKKKNNTRKPHQSLVGIRKLKAIDVDDVNELRTGVFEIVKNNMHHAREVLKGSRVWSNQQVKLYLSLMDKVLPSLTATHNVHEHHASLDDMTVDQLKRLAAIELEKLDPNIIDVPSSRVTTTIEESVVSTMNSPLVFSDVPSNINPNTPLHKGRK